MPLGNTSVHLTIITFQTFTSALTGLYLSLYHSVPLLAFSFSVSQTISFCLLISLCLSVTPSLALPTIGLTLLPLWSPQVLFDELLDRLLVAPSRVHFTITNSTFSVKVRTQAHRQTHTT